MKNKAEKGVGGMSTCSQRRWLTAQRVTYNLYESFV